MPSDYRDSSWYNTIANVPIDSPQKQQMQLEKAQKQIRYCYDNSPAYFKKKLDEYAIKPEDIKTWDDFRNLPILVNKEEERKSQEESSSKENHPFGMYVCASLEKVVLVTGTGGTTGTPTFTYIGTREDLEWYSEIMGRTYEWVGLKPGDTIANLFAMCMHAMGVMGWHTLISYGCRVIPIGAESGTERILRLIDATRPKCLYGTPPLLEHLIERCPDILNKAVGDLGIEILYGSGAPGAGIPSVRKKLEDAYGAKVFDAQVWWVSCDASEYYGMHHLAPDRIIYAEDLVDPETKKPLEIKDGVIGEGVLTFLGYQTKPFLKYSMGDLLQVFTEECPGCGFKGHRARIVGRADEMLMVKGANVYPTAVKNVINSFLPRVTGEMRIVLDKPGPAVDPPMRISVEQSGYLSEQELLQLKQEIEQKLRSQLEFRADVTLVPAETFERAGGVSAKGTLIEKSYEQGQKS